MYKNYAIGLMFEADIITNKINAISASFFKTFTLYFLLPYMLIVMVMITAEIL